jgi:hypothetical protein
MTDRKDDLMVDQRLNKNTPLYVLSCEAGVTYYIARKTIASSGFSWVFSMGTKVIDKKLILTVVVLLALAVILAVCLTTVDFANIFPKDDSRSPVVEVTTLDMSNKKVASDLVGRSIVVPPFAQVWFFDSNQELGVRVLQSKVQDDIAILAVEVGAITQISKQEESEESKERLSQPFIPPTQSATTKPAEPVISEPTKASLAGTIKLVYEKIGSDWFLVGLEPLSMRIVFD